MLSIKKRNAEPTVSVPRLTTRADYGLTQQQVQQRQEAGLVNTPVESPTKSVGQIILGNVCTYFNLIFVALAVLLATVGAYTECTFLGVVIINTVIGTVQEINAKRKLDQLTIFNQPKIGVVREGELVTLPTDQVVLDDVVEFAAGSQICADAVVLSGEVQVNESLVTGESDEVRKEPGAKLLSGSYVTSGVCRARLEAVGADSFAAQLTLEAKREKQKQRGGMLKSLNALLKIIGVAIIPIGYLLYRRQTAILGLSHADGVVNTTAALVGMIPEGLYLLVSVALAVSVLRLGQKRTLVQDDRCIETLARVDVLCVDKTGTITEPDMQVQDLIPLDECPLETAEAVLRDLASNLSADNQTMQAIQNRYRAANFRPAQRVEGFSSVTKRSALDFGESEAYLLGAPEFLLGERFEEYREQIETYTARGSRVLLLGAAESIDEPPPCRPMALLLLENPIRETAAETFRWFREQQVEVKVISGDTPLTAAAAAAAAGIPDTDRWVDATALKTEAEVAAAATQYTVFGRVRPEQKRQLVQALQKAGHTVAMTGDGVNDVLALKSADCSVAMASGSDVASQVAHIVLLDSDFAAMPAVVAEGRRVINNIERAASLFLMKNIFSFFLAIISITAVFAYPLEPLQISLMNAVCIGIPSFFLALEPNENQVRGRFLPNVLQRAFPAALTCLFAVIYVVLFARAFPIDDSIVSTIASVLLTTVGFFMLWLVSRPMTRKHWMLIGAMVLVYLLAVSIAPRLFSLHPLGFGGWLLLVVFLLLMPSVLYVFTRLANFLRTGADKVRRFAAHEREEQRREEERKLEEQRKNKLEESGK